MPTLLEQRRQVDQAGFEAYRVFEEKTDLSERLSLPIENHLSLEVNGGQVFGYTLEGELKRMVDWSEESLNDALDSDDFTGPNSVEISRRKIELDEARAVEDMVASGIEGAAMVVFSPIPDAVVNGSASLNGYRRDLKRTMTRLYRFNGRTVDSITLSLEQSNKAALRYMASQLSMALPDSMQSEDILSSRHSTVLNKEAFLNLPTDIRRYYDEALYLQTGRVFYAGSMVATKQDAMSHINMQQDLVTEHMQAIADIMAQVVDPDELARELEKLRWQTAAALDLRRFTEFRVGSISDKTVTIHANTYNFGGECPTSLQRQSTQEKMGLSRGKSKKRNMTCPFCGLTTYGDPCAPHLVCSKCAAEVKDGRVVSEGIGRANALALTSINGQLKRESGKKNKLSKKKLSNNEIARLTYGPKVSVITIIKSGDAEKLVIDKTGQVLGPLTVRLFAQG